MFSPQVVSGRGLMSGDEQVILLNRNLAAEHGIKVGNSITLTTAGRETTWMVG